MKYCIKCGEKLDNDAKFCTKCGEKIQTDGSLYKPPIGVPDEPEGAESDPESKVKKSLVKLMAFIAIVIIIAVIAVYLQSGFVCDLCGKQCYGKSYRDMWDSDSYFCEDCAREYYWGI